MGPLHPREAASPLPPPTPIPRASAEISRQPASFAILGHLVVASVALHPLWAGLVWAVALAAAWPLLTATRPPFLTRLAVAPRRLTSDHRTVPATAFLARLRPTSNHLAVRVVLAAAAHHLTAARLVADFVSRHPNSRRPTRPRPRREPTATRR